MKILISAFFAALLILISAAHAHHSRAAYDLTKTVTLKDAQVKVWKWSNPHTVLTVVVPDGKGGMQTWEWEGGSPSFLSRAGWKRTDIKAGDKVSVIGHPAQAGAGHGLFTRVTLADGRVMARAGEPGPGERVDTKPPKQDDSL
jgi:hypothetical protein